MGTALETQVDEGYAGRLLAISGLLPFNSVCGSIGQSHLGRKNLDEASVILFGLLKFGLNDDLGGVFASQVVFPT
jgi:hypothetical protein